MFSLIALNVLKLLGRKGRTVEAKKTRGFAPPPSHPPPKPLQNKSDWGKSRTYTVQRGEVIYKGQIKCCNYIQRFPNPKWRLKRVHCGGIAAD